MWRELAARSSLGSSTIPFTADSVLYSKLRPNLNKVVLPDSDGFATSEMIPLKPDASVLKREYLALFLRSGAFVSYAVDSTVGAKMPRVSRRTVLNAEVPLPSISDQESVILRFERINSLKLDCERQLSLLDDLVKSRFVEMFESTEWPTFPAGSVLLNMRNGVSPSKEGLCHARVLTLSAITQGSFDAESWKEGAYPSDPPREKRVSAGEFYICRGNGNRDLVGAGEYSDTDLPDLVFPDTMIAARINFDLISAAYLRYAWGRPAIRRQIESRARTTNGTFKINQRMLSEVLLPLPPLSLQKEFAAFAAEVAKSQFVGRAVRDGLCCYVRETSSTAEREDVRASPQTD